MAIKKSVGDLITDANFTAEEMKKSEILSDLLRDKLNDVGSPYSKYTSRFDGFSLQCLMQLYGEGYIEHPKPNAPILLTTEGVRVASSGSYLTILYDQECIKREERKRNEIEEELKKRQLTQLKFVIKTRYWPFIISILALIVSVLTLLLKLKGF